MTTRSRVWEALGAVLDLDVLEPDEAFTLLTKLRRPRDEEIETARELCRRVGWHPLALDVLRVLVSLHPGDRPYSSWLARLEEPGEDALALADHIQEELPTDVSRNVSTVLRASVVALDDDALDLLRLAIPLAEAPIPAALAAAVLGARPWAASRRSEDAWMIGAKAAEARSLLELDQGASPVFSVHALVRRCSHMTPPNRIGSRRCARRRWRP
jgi:hypothetical protein